MKNYNKELIFAKKLAYQAGEVMLKHFNSTTKTVKNNNTPVTEADIEISKLVISEINKHFPNHAVMDEEIKNIIPDNEYIWVCDPIDGTIPFANGVPTSVFSLALCQNKKPVVAVCYDPFMKRCFYTSKNTKSYLNDKEIMVNNKHFANGTHIMTIPYWINYYLKSKEFNTNLFYKKLHEKNLILSTMDSYVYIGMLVATGKISSAVLPSAHSWDRAAVKLIVENADGLFIDEKGNEMSVFDEHGLTIVTNKTVSDEILHIVNSCLTRTLC